MPALLPRLSFSVCVATMIILLVVVLAIFAPWIAPYGESQIVGGIWESSSKAYLLGTDSIGRDLLSRIIYGARNTVGIAVTATLVAFVLGVTSGLLSVVGGRLFDNIVGRIFDIMLSAPTLIVALFCLTMFGTGTVILVLVIGITEGARIYRVARATALDIDLKDFVLVARLRGEGMGYLMMREILPNSWVTLLAELGLRFCFVLLFISTLSFLGLGLQPPTADWGSMVRADADAIGFGIMTPLIPAGAIAALAISINVIVDWFLTNFGAARHDA